MEITTEFSRDTIPFILTIFLTWLYTNLSKTGDPADVSNRAKLNGSILMGIILGALLMIYEAPEWNVVFNYKAWIKYILMGFLMGASAIGLNQIMKPRPTAEAAQKTVDKLVVAERKEVVKEAIAEKVPIPPPAPAPVPAPLKPDPATPVVAQPKSGEPAK